MLGQITFSYFQSLEFPDFDALWYREISVSNSSTAGGRSLTLFLTWSTQRLMAKGRFIDHTMDSEETMRLHIDDADLQVRGSSTVDSQATFVTTTVCPSLLLNLNWFCLIRRQCLFKAITFQRLY